MHRGPSILVRFPDEEENVVDNATLVSVTRDAVYVAERNPGSITNFFKFDRNPEKRYHVTIREIPDKDTGD